MIVLGVVLVAIPLIGAVAMSVDGLGWRGAALLWMVSILATAMIVTGIGLITSAVTS
ncbi:hypothetical protein [Planobispora rosea]|uniref:hypothetical protein n=1 Tax=Planobispora rosea TaxID=35762 RepID=UPI00159EFF44|nr:hypothetical protein [Planobispora rosea]